jgi:hypothetical protein
MEVWTNENSWVVSDSVTRSSVNLNNRFVRHVDTIWEKDLVRAWDQEWSILAMRWSEVRFAHFWALSMKLRWVMRPISRSLAECHDLPMRIFVNFVLSNQIHRDLLSITGLVAISFHPLGQFSRTSQIDSKSWNLPSLVIEFPIREKPKESRQKNVWIRHERMECDLIRTTRETLSDAYRCRIHRRSSSQGHLIGNSITQWVLRGIFVAFSILYYVKRNAIGWQMKWIIIWVV